VLTTAIKAAVQGLGPQPTARDYRFRTIKPTPLQIDGELDDLDAGTAVAVEIARGALLTVV
jgi:hypothetical protein